MRVSLKTVLALAFTSFFAGAFFGALLAGAGPTPLTPLAVLQCPRCLNGSVEAIISPPAEEEMAGVVSSAQKTLDIMLFQFSSSVMKEAVVQAIRTGARARIILEPRVDSNLETASFLKEKGAEVRWATTDFAYTHAKLAIIDGKRVLVGSINWSKNALTKNREAEVLIEDGALARDFLEVFENDWAAATPVK